MPSITIPRFGGGNRRDNGGGGGNNSSQRPPALAPEEQLNAWRGSGIPEPPNPPPNPMPVPQVPDLSWLFPQQNGGQQYDNGGQTNWMPQQQQPSAWDMRNWYRPASGDGGNLLGPYPDNGGQFGWPSQQQPWGQDQRHMGSLFEALMRLFR